MFKNHLHTNTKIFFIALALVAMGLGLFFATHPIPSLVRQVVNQNKEPNVNNSTQDVAGISDRSNQNIL